MALQVKKRKSKTKKTKTYVNVVERHYRLVNVVDHGKDPKTGKQRREHTYFAKEEYHIYGFDWTWTLEKAKERLKEHQAKEKVVRTNNRKVKAQQRIKEQKLVESAFLPEKTCREFELFLAKKVGFGNGKMPSRIDSHWKGAQKMIAAVSIEPVEYDDNPELFYQYIVDNAYSLSYLQKMLRIVNYWGYFVCKQRKQGYMPVQWPTGKWKERIADAYFDQRPNGLESAPLTPELLEKAKNNLLPQAYRWLFLSVWLGLRPSEIDILTEKNKSKKWDITKDERGVTILKVYQNKLVSLPRDKRWKSIPIIFPQQAEAIQIIKEGKFKRPLTKTIHLHISERHNNYGGRKGFMDLMIGNPKENKYGVGGQKFENVSQWLGHTTLDRSLRNYKNRNIINYDLPLVESKPQLKRVK